MNLFFFYSKHLFLTLILSLPVYAVNTDKPVEGDKRSDNKRQNDELNQAFPNVRANSDASWQTVGYQLNKIKDKTLQLIDREGKSNKLRFNWDIEGVYLNPTVPLALVVTYDRMAFEEEREAFGAVPPWYDCKPFLIDLKTGERFKFDGTLSDEKAAENMTVCADHGGFIKNMWSTNGRYALLGGSRSIVKATDLLPALTGKSQADISVKWLFSHTPSCGGVIDRWEWLTDTTLSFSGGTCGTFIHYLFQVDTGELERYCAPVQKPGYGCPFQPASTYFERIQQLQTAIKTGAFEECYNKKCNEN